jgi:hypothetical protein
MMSALEPAKLVQPSSSGEGLARLQAERLLVARYRDEFTALRARRAHVDAVRALVRRHSSVYGRLIGETRRAKAVRPPAREAA